jgi:hypothetical protein
MALNGKKPAMTICTGACLYQGIGGISLGKFFVLQGAWKGPAILRPVIPPKTVRGKPTTKNKRNESSQIHRIASHRIASLGKFQWFGLTAKPDSKNTNESAEWQS